MECLGCCMVTEEGLMFGGFTVIVCLVCLCCLCCLFWFVVSFVLFVVGQIFFVVNVCL